MPSHTDSASPVRRPTAMTRTSSQQSNPRGSPGNAISKSKQHRASLGRLHARTPSYGKNLHKLTKIVSGDIEQGAPSPTKKKATSPISPNHTVSVRRNTSALSLSKNAAKAPVRKNKSEVSLVRNHSALHLHRGKTSAPLRRNESHGKELDKSKQHKQSRKFEMDDDEGEWTEDSNSPVLTRQSSLSKGSKQPSRVNSPPPVQEAVMQQDDSEDMSPSSPPDHQRELANFEATARVQLLDRRQSRDATQHINTIAPKNIWSGKTLLGGASLAVKHNRPSNNSSTQYSSNNASPFLEDLQDKSVADGSQSTGSHVATPVVGEMDSLRNSLAFEDNLRKSASAANLIRLPLIVKKDKTTNADIETYTFRTTGVAKAGAATQNKVDLWRTQGNVATINGPPVPMLRGAPMEILNNDERRIRLWENAEKELNAVRRFVNPVLESVKRANPKDKSHQHSNGPITNGVTNMTRSAPDVKAANINGVSRQFQENHRPPSRAGARSVRFEVGMDNDISRGYEGVEPVDEILQRLWSTNEGTTVEG